MRFFYAILTALLINIYLSIEHVDLWYLYKTEFLPCGYPTYSRKYMIINLALQIHLETDIRKN